MKKYVLKITLTLLFLFVYVLPAYADPATPPTDADDPPAAPIENWALLLVLIGITIGVKFYYDNKRKAVN